MTLWHNGPIEEYAVRDCTYGEEKNFTSFDEAYKYLQARRADYPDHAIILIAVIDGG